MRLIFLGSGEFGLPTLERLHERHELAAVVSQPDQPAGRGRRTVPTPVAQWAEKSGVRLFKVADVNEVGVVEQLAGLKADAAVVIAFGQKLGESLIGALGRLTINLHASLLPKYRGAAPINWAVINGEAQTGLSVIGLSQRMDGGLIYGQAATTIEPLETAGELHDRLAQMGPDLVEKILSEFEAGTLRGRAQDESAVLKARKLGKADGWVRFDVDAQDVRNRVHGLTPWPGVKVRWVRGGEAESAGELLILRRVTAEPDLSCFIGLSKARKQPVFGTVVEGHRVIVKDGWVRLLEVQSPGGRPMKIEEFVRGHPMKAGDLLVGGGGAAIGGDSRRDTRRL